MVNKIKEKRKMALMDFKKKLLSVLGEDVLSLKLFGSQARGDFRKDSDIDVLIVLKETFSKRKENLIFNIATDVSLEYNIDLSPKIFSRKEYKEKLNLQIPFFLNVKKEGVSL